MQEEEGELREREVWEHLKNAKAKRETKGLCLVSTYRTKSLFDGKTSPIGGNAPLCSCFVVVKTKALSCYLCG